MGFKLIQFLCLLVLLVQFDYGFVIGNRSPKSIRRGASFTGRSKLRDKTICMDPSDQYLEYLFTEYSSRLRLYEENLILRRDFSSMPTNSDDDYDQNGESKKLAGEDEPFMSNDRCYEENRNQTSPGGKSKCPWVYVVSYRHNKYPKYRTQVKCTCKTCANEDNPDVQCTPVIKQVPVLRRNASDCDRDGFYKWNFSVEPVNYACVCAYKYNKRPLSAPVDLGLDLL